MKIYLACPYSDPDPSVSAIRFHKVNEAAADLMKQGHIVFSPISHSHPIAVQCDLPKGFDYWEEFDRSFIEWCDLVHVLQLDGWEESFGVKKEIAIAKDLGKLISYALP